VSVAPGTPVISENAPVERVGRGLALALLTLPIGAIGAALIFGFFSGLPFFATAASGLAISILAQRLYARGAGSPPRRGLVGLILVTALVVPVTGAAAMLGSIYGQFQAVGGRGGPFGETFQQTLASRFANEFETFVFIIALLAVGGAAGFINRSGRTAASGGMPAPQPQPQPQPTVQSQPQHMVGPTVPLTTPVPPPNPGTAVAAPPSTPPPPPPPPPLPAPAPSLPGITLTPLPGQTNLPGTQPPPPPGPAAG
jgi:hypothetical protein